MARSVQLTAPVRSRLAPDVSGLTAVIKGKEKNRRPWSETAKVESLSASNAGFLIARPCDAGRLVSLIMPMPLNLRRYDLDKRLYRIWGLVQHCYEARGEDVTGFHIGVALMGKNAPRSYHRNPMQCYRIAGMDGSGLWRMDEMETSFSQRSSARFWKSIEASLYKLDEHQRSIATEITQTENISESGASVFSDMKVTVGECLRFQSSTPSFSSLSVVRQCRVGTDDRTRIHLEFVENAFPILEIEPQIEEQSED